MEEKDRKILTEFLGECWHEWRWRPGQGKFCKNCDIDLYGKDNIFYHQRIPTPENRTFDTWNDFGMLWVQASNSTSWCAFFGWAIERFSGTKGFGFSLEGIDWFIDKDRFPFLVLEAIKEGVL